MAIGSTAKMEAAASREAAEREAALRAQAEAVELWRIIQVSPGCEAKVIEALRQKRPGRGAVVAYAPMETVFRDIAPWRAQAARAKSGAGKTAYKRPLIRGYVFAALDDRTMATVHELEGALRVLMINGAPAAIKGQHMRLLIHYEAAGRYDLTRKRLSRAARCGELEPGDEVKLLMEGPLSGFVGVVQQLSHDRRAKVLLSVVGWTSRVINAELADLELLRRGAVDKASESPLSSGPTPLGGGDDRLSEDTRPGEQPIQSDAAA